MIHQELGKRKDEKEGANVNGRHYSHSTEDKGHTLSGLHIPKKEY